MGIKGIIRAGLVAATALGLAGCSGATNPNKGAPGISAPSDTGLRGGPAARPRGTLGDLFRSSADVNTSVRVNKYIWNAALNVLSFLPVESVDPFTGVIVTGYGRPPGGGQAYRATIYVQDPALDARSLNLALQTRSGPVAPATVRAVEDAILTRARELRIADTKR